MISSRRRGRWRSRSSIAGRRRRPDFPNYIRSTWGPKAAQDLVTRDGRRAGTKVITDEILKQSPLFGNGDPLFLEQVILALKPKQVGEGEMVIKKGDIGRELFLVEQGEVEILDDAGNVVKVLRDGDIFGEVALLTSSVRNANVRAKIPTDLYTLDKRDFSRILHDHPQFANRIQEVARERYTIEVQTSTLMQH